MGSQDWNSSNVEILEYAGTPCVTKKKRSKFSLKTSQYNKWDCSGVSCFLTNNTFT